jgi:ferritin-like metal-binding protein YciE
LKIPARSRFFTKRAEEMSMKEAHFEQLFKEELEDIYDAEKQILQALPKMAEAASSEELVAAFNEHLEVTRQQVKRLEKVFQKVGAKPGKKTCEGMQGLLREGEKLIAEMPKSAVLDAGLIGAAQKVEHYEISAYGTVRTMAEMLGQEDAAELLEETLEEEKETDESLTEIAESIMSSEAGGEEDEEEDDEEEIEEEEEEEKA